MSTIRQTLWVLGGAGLALAIQEALAIVSREEGDTISARGAEAIRQYPVVAGLAVATVVHMATPTRRPDEPLPWWRRSTVAMIGGAMLGATWCRYDRSRPTRRS
jgi:hypothetical protein